jgi:hypothetical protein
MAEHFNRHHATFFSKKIGQNLDVMSKQCNRKNASHCKEVHGPIGGIEL